MLASGADGCQGRSDRGFQLRGENMSDELDKPALDEWARALVDLGEGIAAALVRSIQRLADDRSLPELVDWD